jgi:hypothetical protein
MSASKGLASGLPGPKYSSGRVSVVRERLRLVAWNCAGGFHKKARILDAHAPDILVLSEASEDCVSNLGGDASGVWAGIHPGYGLAVLGMNGWKIEKVDIVVEEHIFLPVRAFRGSEEQFLIGVCVKKDGDYVGPTFRALTTLSPFIAETGAILAGDFNQSVKFDSKSEVRIGGSDAFWTLWSGLDSTVLGTIATRRTLAWRRGRRIFTSGGKITPSILITHSFRIGSGFHR